MQKLNKISKLLILKEPFYGLFLLTLNKKWNDQIPTAAVSLNNINTELNINEEFWDSLSDEKKLGVLKHELLHICFHHLQLFSKYSNKKLFNIAADLEVNQYIDPNNLPGSEFNSYEEYEIKKTNYINELTDKLEKGLIDKDEYKKQLKKTPIRAIFLDDFNSLNLKIKAGLDYYYKELQKAQDNPEKLPQSLQNLLNDNSNEHNWDEVNDLSDNFSELIKKQIDYQLKEVANNILKSRGTVPRELTQYINSLFIKEESKFNWKAFLRRFVSNSQEIYTNKTRRKPSNRFKDSPGLQIKQKKHILVAVDTSGSVSNAELEEIFNEIYHITKTGVQVTLIQCDTQIRSIEKFTLKDSKNIKVQGRGGTSFDPVINYFNDNQNKFTSLIYLTDGEAPNPMNKVKGRILWVLTSCSALNKNLPGLVIKLN